MNVVIFWDTAPRSPYVNRRLSETSIQIWTMWRCIPEDGNILDLQGVSGSYVDPKTNNPCWHSSWFSSINLSNGTDIALEFITTSFLPVCHSSLLKIAFPFDEKLAMNLRVLLHRDRLGHPWNIPASTVRHSFRLLPHKYCLLLHSVNLYINNTFWCFLQATKEVLGKEGGRTALMPCIWHLHEIKYSVLARRKHRLLYKDQ
jgi:hypothetical protein